MAFHTASQDRDGKPRHAITRQRKLSWMMRGPGKITTMQVPSRMEIAGALFDWNGKGMKSLSARKQNEHIPKLEL